MIAGGELGIVEIMMATHAGMTPSEFEKIVSDWLATAQASARFKRPYTRHGLSADARVARLSAGEWLQDVHRLGRRHRVHAAVDGAGLWDSA